MSALKNYEISSCRFTNDIHDTIEVLYRMDGSQDLYSYYVPAIQPDNEDLKFLLTSGWDFETIDRATTLYNKNQKDLFRQFHRYLARDAVKVLQEEMEKKIENMKQEELQKSNIISAVLKNNQDEEAVFRAKLAILEIESIKISKDRELKMKIRKSKTLLELFVTIKEHI